MKKSAARLETTRKITIEWYKKLRKLFSLKVTNLNLTFGGLKSIVQIDESKFLALKSNIGAPTENIRRKYWVFGLSDGFTKQVYIKLVSNRK